MVTTGGSDSWVTDEGQGGSAPPPPHWVQTDSEIPGFVTFRRKPGQKGCARHTRARPAEPDTEMLAQANRTLDRMRTFRLSATHQFPLLSKVGDEGDDTARHYCRALVR